MTIIDGLPLHTRLNERIYWADRIRDRVQIYLDLYGENVNVSTALHFAASNNIGMDNETIISFVSALLKAVDNKLYYYEGGAE